MCPAESSDPSAVQHAQGVAVGGTLLHRPPALCASQGEVSRDPHALNHHKVSHTTGLSSCMEQKNKISNIRNQDTVAARPHKHQHPNQRHDVTLDRVFDARCWFQFSWCLHLKKKDCIYKIGG